MFDRLRGVCGGVEEIGVGFQQWCVAGSQARLENPPYTSTVLRLVGGGSVNAAFVATGRFNEKRIVLLPSIEWKKLLESLVIVLKK